MSARWSLSRTAWIAAAIAGLMLPTLPAMADGTYYLDPNPRPGRFQMPNEGAGGGPVGGGAGSRLFESTMNDLREGASASSSPFAGATSALNAWQAWRAANSALSDLDRELDAGMSGGGDGAGPQVPSSCVDSDDPSCAACFQAAYGRVNFVRMTLERLRSIHARTINFIKAKEAFGDSVAPIHGMSGLAWQASRADIEKSRAQFNITSMNKYEQLIGTMEAALGDVATCERVHFNNPDWDTRYGFVYLQAIKTAYRPDDH
jgi:hypothetical protein